MNLPADGLIDDFVMKVAETKLRGPVANPWQNERQRHNLSEAIKRFRDAPLILVGEAPGWRGAGQTGVPLTSEGVAIERGWKWLTIEDPRNPVVEQTARHIWQILSELEVSTALCWNVFALHPHHEGQIRSNRRPTRNEIEDEKNLRLLSGFLEIFAGRRVVAIGKIAEHTLKRFCQTGRVKLALEPVRHPSFGGFCRCREQLRRHLLPRNELVTSPST
jgi:hypothetical protein